MLYLIHHCCLDINICKSINQYASSLAKLPFEGLKKLICLPGSKLVPEIPCFPNREENRVEVKNHTTLKKIDSA